MSQAKFIDDLIDERDELREMSQMCAKQANRYADKLRRILAIADAGEFRDTAGLSLAAHPIMDELRALQL